MSFDQIYDIDCVFEGFCHKGAIFISSLPPALCSPLLQELRITAIISVTRVNSLPPRSFASHLHIAAQDSEDQPISQHFEATFQFLDAHRKEGNVLVHCMQGISRSATIVAAYLLKKFRYSLDKVLTLLKRKRHQINPNKGFLQQLRKYSLELGINDEIPTRDNKLRVRKSWSMNIQKHDVQAQQKSKELEERGRKGAGRDTDYEIDHGIDLGIEDKIRRLREDVIRAGKLRAKRKGDKNKVMAKQMGSLYLSLSSQ